MNLFFREKLELNDALAGAAAALAIWWVLPDILTQTQTVLALVYFWLGAVAIIQWIRRQARRVKEKRESLKISRGKKKTVDFRLHRCVYIPARRAFENE